MSRFVTQSAAAFAAIFIVAFAMTAVVTVPPAEAAVLVAPIIA